jgi:hypothetical protein
MPAEVGLIPVKIGKLSVNSSGHFLPLGSHGHHYVAARLWSGSTTSHANAPSAAKIAAT